MRRLVLVLAACAGKPPATPVAYAPATTPHVAEVPAGPQEPSTQMIEGAPCVVRGTQVDPPVELRVHGKAFAIVRAAEVDVRAAPVGATAQVATADFTLVGDLDLRRATVRPRERLLHGWLAIRDAQPGSVNAESMVLDFKLPTNVVAATTPFVRLPCDALTMGAPPDRPADGKLVWLRPASKIALRAVPTGPIVATIETPRVTAAMPGVEDPKRDLDVASLQADELARDGRLVRVRTGFRNYVEGWIDAGMLGPDQGTGRFGTAATPDRRKELAAIRCPHEVAIYVRDGDLIRVGTYRAGGAIRRAEDRQGEVVVDLGLPPRLPVDPVGSEPVLEPFVKARSLEGGHD